MINKNENAYNFQYVSIGDIYPNTKNAIFSQKDVNTLKMSIQEHGLEHNLVVVRDGGRYRLVSGERRYRAIQMILDEDPQFPAFRSGIPCQVISGIDELEEEIRLLRANTDIRELKGEEKRKAVLRLLELYRARKDRGELNAVQRQLAEDLEISLRQIQKYAATEKLGPELEQLVANGTINLDDAARYAVLDQDLQQNVAELYRTKGRVTPPEIEELKRVRNEKEELRKQMEAETLALRDKLQELEMKIDSKDEEIRTLQASMDNPENDIERLVNEKRSADEQVRALLRQKDSIQMKYDLLREKQKQPIEISPEDMQRLKKEVRDEAALSSMEKELDILKKDYLVIGGNEGLKTRVKILNDRFAELSTLINKTK